MNKVIFLDIDGVLNSHEYYDRLKAMGFDLFGMSVFTRSLYEFDCKAVQLMSDFADEVGASVVISSSWRINNSVEQIADWFKKCGWGDAPIIGATPYIPNVKRGTEINTWISQNNVDQYVIFDDEVNDFLEGQHLIGTNKDFGLQAHHIDAARVILNKGEQDE